MANTLTDDDVIKLANLSKLNLSADQIKSLKPQLNDILEYVGELAKLDLTGVETTSEITGLHNITAEDEVGACLENQSAVSQAKNHQGFVVVPAVFGEEADA